MSASAFFSVSGMSIIFSLLSIFGSITLRPHFFLLYDFISNFSISSVYSCTSSGANKHVVYYHTAQKSDKSVFVIKYFIVLCVFLVYLCTDKPEGLTLFKSIPVSCISLCYHYMIWISMFFVL